MALRKTLRLRLPTKAKAFLALVAIFFPYVWVVVLVYQASVSGVSANSQVRLSTIQSTQPLRAVNHGDSAWNYNFASMPDGPLPSSDWKFENGNKVADYNNELETYTSRTTNVRVQDGNLIIEAKPEDLNGKHYTSARVNTKDLFDFTYGTFEADMMLPAGAGTWPAVWLLPTNSMYKASNFGIANNDPYAWALNGEIDFAESIGSLPGQNIPAAHSYNEIRAQPTYTPAFVTNAYAQYHRYGVIKTPDSITFTLDGVPYATRHRTSSSPLDWPYNQPYYVVLDLAVGGKWAGADGIDNSSAPWLLKVRSLSYTPLN